MDLYAPAECTCPLHVSRVARLYYMCNTINRVWRVMLYTPREPETGEMVIPSSGRGSLQEYWSLLTLLLTSYTHSQWNDKLSIPGPEKVHTYLDPSSDVSGKRNGCRNQYCRRLQFQHIWLYVQKCTYPTCTEIMC